MRRRPRSAALLRLAYRVAYRVLQVWATAAHPTARGVKCVVRDGERVVFVRHHYGNRETWELPGGGARRGEPPEAAARREALEELGVDVRDWQLLGGAAGDWYGRSEMLSVFAAPWPGGRLRPDPVEIAHVGWFALDAPPSPLGPTTRAALAAVRN